MLKWTIPFLVLLGFLGGAIIGLFFPSEYQGWLIERFRRSRIGRLNPFLSFYDSPMFTFALRLGGVMSLGAVLLIIWLVLTGHRP